MTKRLPQTRFYQVRPANDLGWARLWVTTDGCISVVSDYGNFGYWFGAPACEFRQFLVTADEDYLLNKFSGGKREFDEKRTVAAVRQRVIELRRRGSLSKEEARDEWDLIRETDWSAEWSRHEWYQATKMSDAWEEMRTRYPSDIFHFMKKMWPLLVAELKSELARETEHQHPGFVD